MAEKLAAPIKKPRIPIKDYLGKLLSRGLTAEGQQAPDPTPIAPPIGYKRQPTMVEIVRDMVRSERLAQEALASGHETFEESEDFDIGDDPEDLRSGFENDFDPPVRELLRAGQEAMDAKKTPGVEGAEPPPKAPSPPPQGGGDTKAP